MAASSGTLGQKKSLSCQSDQFLVISGSPDRFIGRIWRTGDRLAAALHSTQNDSFNQIRLLMRIDSPSGDETVTFRDN